MILSITYLTYQHPPATWVQKWLRPEKRRDRVGVSEGKEKLESIKEDAHGEKQQESVKDDLKEEETESQSLSLDIPVITAEEDGDETPQARPTLIEPATPDVPSFTLDDSHAVEAKEEAEEEEEDERDNLPPPVFPAVNSAQRASAMPAPVNPASSNMMPPPAPKVSTRLMAPSPPKPSPSLMAPPPAPNSSSGGLMPPPRGPPIRTQPSTASSLRVPSTGPLPYRGPPVSSASQARPNTLAPSRIDTPNSRNKVQLTPGHSPLDWATLARTKNLSNVPHFMRVTPSLLKHFNGRKDKETGLKKDAWSVYQGKVYNISPYLPFHPGGEGELLRSAGKDGTAMFNDVHPWVNWEGMLSSCLVGILVSESEEDSGLEGLD